MSTMSTTTENLTKKDFKSDQDVRWCPGCGDYAILNAVQGALAKLGKSRENTVFISGIGCSSRFPYYMDTYGFHTIHGRAPALATGTKIANPDLDVWVVTGDGDAMSIGGNHFIHALRRHIDIKVLLFNNRIYGLTKGQYSPTSPIGKVTKSTPMGSLDTPFNPITLALAANASFVARSVDIMGPHLTEVINAAAAHKGSAFVEIFQNCNIFNDGAWDHLVDRNIRDDMLVDLKHGEVVKFGRDLDRGIVIEGFAPRVVKLSEVDEKDLLVWDEKSHPALSYLLATMTEGEFPTPIGVFRNIEVESFEAGIHRQAATAREKFGAGSLKKLIHSGDLWTVAD
ncbi:MAG: 2-oxoacid:ferredoxin oxidoreductase subunit beta [Planctomycetes bacterium]|nr:2-oxoacid:ferredoxin oxidoreductase subunit beta [Planctomycetota bacterium]